MDGDRLFRGVVVAFQSHHAALQRRTPSSSHPGGRDAPGAAPITLAPRANGDSVRRSRRRCGPAARRVRIAPGLTWPDVGSGRPSLSASPTAKRTSGQQSSSKPNPLS